MDENYLQKGFINEVSGALNRGGGGSGLSSTAKTLLITVLHNAIYSTDQSANITALETALGGGGTDKPEEPDVPDVPVVTTYAITSELINVSSDNNQNSITEGTAYTATLTADEGYVLDSVTVTMGGVDVTADVYADGVITIASVTGNIEIVASAVIEEKEAVLPTDGLLGYWDMRNPAEVVAKDWHWAYPSNEGDGGLYASLVGGSKGDKVLPTFNEYGAQGTQTSFQIMRDADTYPAQVDYGTEFTFVLLTHGKTPSQTNGGTDCINGIVNSNIQPNWEFMAQYYKTDGSTAKTERAGSGNGDNSSDYNFSVNRVNGEEMKVIMDTSEHVFLGTDYDNFNYWNQRVSPSTAYGDGYVTAFALYNRALTDAEIEEAREFFKTLEVTA